MKMTSRKVQRAATPKPRRIYMSFVLRERWYCMFLEEDLRPTRKMRRNNLCTGGIFLQVGFYTKAPCLQCAHRTVPRARSRFNNVLLCLRLSPKDAISCGGDLS